MPPVPVSRPILVTGFQPFDGLPSNPSAAVLPLLPDEIDGISVYWATLPVDTQALPAELARLYQMQPQLVLHTGLALDRQGVTIEKTAVNWLAFDIPDNAGKVLRGEPIEQGAPAQLPARLPIAEIVSALAAADIPAAASESAGTFLCNQAMYSSLRALPDAIPVGFVHLPADEALAEKVSWPALPLSTQARALQLVVQAGLRSRSSMGDGE